MTALGARIAAQIRATGPISVAEYVAMVMTHPEGGYYQTAKPFGIDGDFMTSPELSQVFGDLVGVWAVAVWQQMGAPASFRLIELGPGRGTLMHDVLRVSKVRPGFLAAADVHLVEVSEKLRKAQGKKLASLGVAPTWHYRIGTLPPGPAIILANEFFDALPFHQYIRIGGFWHERMVGLDKDGRLTFGVGPPAPIRIDDLGAPQGEILELSPASNAVMSTLSARVASEGGAFLAIDYGYFGRPPLGSTLSVVRRYVGVDPLDAPGRADLSFHVNFDTLRWAASDAGAIAHGPVTQREFLMNLGLPLRVDNLEEVERGFSQRDAVFQLVAPDMMGDLFKVIAAAAPGVTPPGFVHVEYGPPQRA